MFLKIFKSKVSFVRSIIMVFAGIVLVLVADFEVLASVAIVITAFVISLILDLIAKKKSGCPNAIQVDKYTVIQCKLGDICSHQYRSSCCSEVRFSGQHLKCPGRNKKPKKQNSKK